MPFGYFILSLRNNDNLGLFAFVFSPGNKDKTTRNSKINKALISVAKYFAPLFIIFSPVIHPHEITIYFIISGRIEKMQFCILSSFSYFGR